jgi:hypothetical protein
LVKEEVIIPKTNMITYNETIFLLKESLNKECLAEIGNFWNFNSYEYEVFLKKGKLKSFIIGETIK